LRGQNERNEIDRKCIIKEGIKERMRKKIFSKQILNESFQVKKIDYPFTNIGISQHITVKCVISEIE
jgi:hypothetical protein